MLCTYPLLDMLRYHRFLVAGYWVPEYGSSEDPVILMYDTKAGHSGGRPVDAVIDELTAELRLLLWQIGG